MTDEAGSDEKIIAVPIGKVFPAYRNIGTVRDLPELTLDRIEHFFAHYKDLERNKWVKIDGWRDAVEARQLVLDSVAAYETALEKTGP